MHKPRNWNRNMTLKETKAEGFFVCFSPTPYTQIQVFKKEKSLSEGESQTLDEVHKRYLPTEISRYIQEKYIKTIMKEKYTAAFSIV